jgi:hypothetical protein
MNKRKMEEKHSKTGQPKKRSRDSIKGVDGDYVENAAKKPRGRPPAKPKAVVCECFQPHESLTACNEEKKFRKFCNIASK